MNSALLGEDAQCRFCGHTRRQHDHYRAGTDCSACDCKRFRARRRWLPWL